MYYKIGCLFLLVLALSGCTNDVPDKTEESQSEELYQPIEYSEDEGKKEGSQIPTGEDQFFKRSSQDEMRESKYSETTRGHDNSFNNEESMAITQEVNELKEVTMTQAFTNGEKAYVAVMVNPYDWRDEDIEEKVLEKAEGVTDLPVVVYTNINSWDKKKDENARRAADEAPDKVRERIRDFFKENEEE
ncbi:YhcN/YlaJ family sporulation lipoprotein [Halobacillus sp. A5]|uniref:YhcN/YlaJ family sporulation lipoprotein n=1 Tax=Halobacillus sp. A5 TaxID=2880263 RepID=UPI0020A62E82|nr:YhcN/YlaJ family sporulation lipoprotein [Halobacillus sp. A5]MCP3025554.1 YhcN/YlaJ family sporulation lipoprotein [Halobacillus sp. A5]